MQEDLTQNRSHPGISMRFETCEVWVRLFKCVSPLFDVQLRYPDEGAATGAGFSAVFGLAAVRNPANMRMAENNSPR